MRLLDLTFTGDRPAHVVSGEGWLSLFYDGQRPWQRPSESKALAIKIEDLSKTSPQVDIWKSPAPQHGIAVPLGKDKWIISTPNPAYAKGNDKTASSRPNAFQLLDKAAGWKPLATYPCRLFHGHATLDGAAIQVKYGFEGFLDRVVTEDIGPDQSAVGWTPEGERSIVSGFAEVTTTLGRFDLITAARIDHYALQGEGNNPTAGGGTGGLPNVPVGPFEVDKSETAVSPKITASVRPTDWLQLYASYGLGFRPPAITETLMSNRHPGFVGNFVRFFPNPFLDPERSKGWEVGANLAFDGVLVSRDKLRLKANYYDNDIENYILAMNSGTRFFFQNVPGTSEVSGVELEVNYDVGFAFASLGYHHINADLPFEPGGAPLANYAGPPEQVWTLTGGVRLFDERLVLGGRIRDVPESVYPGQASSGTGSYSVPPYRLYDAFASYKVSDHLDLNFTAENLTDELYTPGMSADSVNGRGLTMKFGLAARL